MLVPRAVARANREAAAAARAAAPPPPPPRVVPEASEQQARIYSHVYIWQEDAWSKKGTQEGAGRAHTEVTAYQHVKDTYPKGWIGFKQNAPPCSGDFDNPEPLKYCADYFSAQSKAEGRDGFVFTVTADHAGFLAAWTKLNRDVQPGFPFTLFCVAGKWTFAPPGAGGPQKGPV